MSRQLSTSDVNHLRRLLGWVRCEVGQSPEEHIAMVREIGEKVGEFSDYGKAAMVKSYEHSAAIPKYIRAALKALQKVVVEIPGETVDAEVETMVKFSRKQLAQRKNKPLLKHSQETYKP